MLVGIAHQAGPVKNPKTSNPRPKDRMYHQKRMAFIVESIYQRELWSMGGSYIASRCGGDPGACLLWHGVDLGPLTFSSLCVCLGHIVTIFDFVTSLLILTTTDYFAMQNQSFD